MAATYTKPTEAMHWADTSVNITEPLEAKKNEGWLTNEIPPSSWENWMKNNIGEWLEWLDERLFDDAGGDSFLIRSPGDGSLALNIGNTHITAYKDILPVPDDTNDLGSTVSQWKDLWLDGTANIDTFVLSTVAGEGVGSNFIPTTDDTYDLGSTTYEWKDLYMKGSARINTLILSSVAGEGVFSNLAPITANAYDIGNATYYWRNVYAGTYYGKNTTVQSFDTYDDLALAESYKPSGKYIERRVRGESKQVELGDSESLPWPMLDETGEFLDYNTSLVFLLGCIKQLDEKVKTLKEIAG